MGSSDAMVWGVPLPCDPGKKFPRDEDDQREAQRGNQQGNIRRNDNQLVEQIVRLLAGDCKQDCDQAYANCPDPEHEPSLPIQNQSTLRQGKFKGALKHLCIGGKFAMHSSTECVRQMVTLIRSCTSIRGCYKSDKGLSANLSS